jgi:Ferric reductase NAD binding domain
MPSTKNTGSFDIEKAASSSNSSSSPRYPFEIMSGRPDVVNIVTEIVDRADKNESIAVAACGPDSLMQITRKTVARNIRGEGPSLEFHCEQFGW